MSVKVPEERVYYYECSAGRFRLVSFLPRVELGRLAAAGRIDQKVLEDFPDGVDIDCTAADFDEFEKSYRYRPEHGADELRAAFLAIFSSTRDWTGFRGSGFLPASSIEDRLEPVEPILRRTAAEAEPEVASTEPTPLEQRVRRARRRSALRRRRTQALERLEMDGIDPGKDLRQQSFGTIQMSEGEPAPEFFAKVHRQRSEP